MKIAIYGKTINDDCKTSILQLFARLEEHQCDILVFKPFLEYLRKEIGLHLPVTGVFTKEDKLLPATVDFMMSIGGDGTFLETVSLVRDKMIPIVGMNTGRLGFLSNIAREETRQAVNDILSGNFTLENRSLLQVTSAEASKFAFPFALNEFVIQKSGSSMVTVHAWINDEFLNSYWADGLIISTPTGSTAYSMSVGGPIVMPSAACFIISPIAPHNLTMRPIIIPDQCKLTLKAESRGDRILASLDNQSIELQKDASISLSRASFTIQTVRLKNLNYFDTLRNKLMWGADRRN
jgi:NAD+ kinase